MKLIMYTAALMLILNLPSFGADKTILAIVDFDYRDISKNEAGKITELVRNEMVNSGEFIIVERTQVDKILLEQGFQMTGCTDVSCAVQVGKLLSARKILVGTVMRMDEKIVITGRIVDVERGVAEYGEKEIAGSRNDLYDAVERFCDKLTERITGKKVARRTEQEKKKKNQYSIVKYYSTSAGDDNYSDWGWTSIAFGGASIIGFAAGGINYQSKGIMSIGPDYYLAIAFFNPGSAPLMFYLDNKEKSKKDDDRLKTRNYIFIGAGAAGGVSILSLIIWGALYGKSTMTSTAATKAGDIALYVPPLYNLNPAGLRSGMVNLGLGIKMFF